MTDNESQPSLKSDSKSISDKSMSSSELAIEATEEIIKIGSLVHNPIKQVVGTEEIYEKVMPLAAAVLKSVSNEISGQAHKANSVANCKD